MKAPCSFPHRDKLCTFPLQQQTKSTIPQPKPDPAQASNSGPSYSTHRLADLLEFKLHLLPGVQHLQLLSTLRPAFPNLLRMAFRLLSQSRTVLSRHTQKRSTRWGKEMNSLVRHSSEPPVPWRKLRLLGRLDVQVRSSACVAGRLFQLLRGGLHQFEAPPRATCSASASTY